MTCSCRESTIEHTATLLLIVLQTTKVVQRKALDTPGKPSIYLFEADHIGVEQHPVVKDLTLHILVYLQARHSHQVRCAHAMQGGAHVSE